MHTHLNPFYYRPFVMPLKLFMHNCPSVLEKKNIRQKKKKFKHSSSLTAKRTSDYISTNCIVPTNTTVRTIYQIEKIKIRKTPQIFF